MSDNLPSLLQAFFLERLAGQMRASPHTIAAYRDTFRLLLRFAKQRLGKAPSNLLLEDLAAPFVAAFLDDLEQVRGVTPRTRNLRLAAIRSFFHYLSFQVPSHLALIQRVLAIPGKRQDHALVDFLTTDEVDALLAAPDRGTWGGRRDHALILLDVETGLRVSELTALRCESLQLGPGAHVRCRGKGRKERITPISKVVQPILADWLRERNGGPLDPLFPNARGGVMSTDGVQYLLTKHVAVAEKRCPSLKKKRLTPHVLRHTRAMSLLSSGIDRSLIALWLGHESIDTTYMYVVGDLTVKERMLEKTRPPNVPPGRYKADDDLLDFLKHL